MARHILFVPACGAEIGGGHVLRDIALAQAVHARGAICTFALPPYGASLLERFGQGLAALYPMTQAVDPRTFAAAVAASGADVLVLDDYGLDAETVEKLGPGRPRVVVVDDLANRPHLCDLLVDPGYGRAAMDYAGLVPEACALLTGPAYALLRPGFSRAAAVTARGPQVDRVFVSLGLSDVEGVSGRVVERLRALAPGVLIDVALAGDATSRGRLAARAEHDPGLSLHIDARDVATLMRSADVAVGAGGASTWERCASGLASIAVIVADNQRRGVRALEADGVLLACDLHEPGFERAFDAAWRALQSPTLRATLANRASALCDGRGAERVAEAILAL